MAVEPSPRDSAAKQALNFLLFLLKVMLLLGGLTAFGFAVFWLRRSMG